MTPNKTLAAVCGLFCPSCGVYLATQEGQESLERLAKRIGRAPEEIACDGCRSARRFPFCAECVMFRCAKEKGLDFCGACEEFPCKDIQEFQAARPHRIELWESQKRINDVGFEQWFAEMEAHYRCPECQAMNSAYDMTCRSCGASPSCEYVAQHRDEILPYLAPQPAAR